MFSRKGIKELGTMRKLSSKQLRDIEDTRLKLPENVREKENIIRLLLNNSNALLTTGNQLKILKNGEETFNEILSAIEEARHHIHLEYYIIANDKIGNRFKKLLIKKAREGVEIRVIIDDVGSWGLGKKFFSELIKAGVEIYSFMDVRFPRLTSRVNFRNHRKIAIIDGTIGFLGGLNIADRYIDGIPKLGPWHDTHLKIEGDAVACIQVVFVADWYFVIHANLTGKKYFPRFSESSGVPVQIVTSGPDSDWENISQAYFTAITNARKNIFIVTPYLMPPSEMLKALKIASLSNVDVKILIPENSDSRTSKWCSFSYVEELLEAGIKVNFFKNGFIHSKFMVVDDVVSTIGTSNFDFRSFETNFEVNAFIYEKEFTAKLKDYFFDNLKNSREIKLSEWKNRSLFFKFKESLAHIISPLL